MTDGVTGGVIFTLAEELMQVSLNFDLNVQGQHTEQSMLPISASAISRASAIHCEVKVVVVLIFASAIEVHVYTTNMNYDSLPLALAASEARLDSERVCDSVMVVSQWRPSRRD